MRSALLLTLACAGCLVPLDREVPRAAFRGSREALERATAATRGATPAEVEVGWAAREIAVVDGETLAGYGSRAGVPLRGVHDPIFARAFALRAGGEPVVILAVDLLLVDAGLRVELEERLRGAVARERLILTATHSHGSLGGYAESLAFRVVTGPPDERAREAISSALESSAREALSRLAPGRVALGEVEAPGLSTNRIRRSGEPVDPVAGVLLVERSADGARAALVAYGAHATVVSDLELSVTADYPGVMSRALEARGLALAAFAAGAVGSMSPRAGWSEHPGAAWQGEALAEAVWGAIPALARGLSAHAPIVCLRSELVLPEPQWRVVFRDWAVWGPLAQIFVPSRAPLTALAVGSATWVSLPLELSGELSGELRARARARGRPLVLSSFGGDYAGYVTPPAAYDMPDEEKGEMADYETRLMGFYGPHMGHLAAAAAWRAMLAAQSLAAGAAAPAPLVRRPPPSLPPPPEPPRP